MLAAPASWRHVTKRSGRSTSASSTAGSSRRARRTRGRRPARRAGRRAAARRCASRRHLLLEEDCRALELRLRLVGRVEVADRPLAAPLGRQQQDAHEGRVGRVDAVATTGYSAPSNHASSGEYVRSSPSGPSIRIAPASRQRMPGPGCTCRYATPPGRKSTRSHRITYSPHGSSSMRAASFAPSGSQPSAPSARRSRPRRPRTRDLSGAEPRLVRLQARRPRRRRCRARAGPRSARASPGARTSSYSASVVNGSTGRRR